MSEQQPTTAVQDSTEHQYSHAQALSVETTRLSIVVPLYNEAECVTPLMSMLVDVDAELSDLFDFEFVLVDDGSDDGTTEMLQEAIMERTNFKVISHENNRGIAAAIHTGVLHSANELVASIDGDGSYDVLLIQHMVPLLTPEIDMVTASPYHPSGEVENVPQWRLWLSRRASGLYRLALRQKLHCYTSCFRVYRRSKIVDLEPENAGFVGVAELVWKLDRQGSHIVECPAKLRTRVAGHSKMKIFRSSMRHLHLVTQIWRDRILRRFQGGAT